ncbi:MAG TPA: sialidase family protein [Solirubrobacteraceae bacterium]|nr:sialidase family protein [Solirubrobacteraceae bacterium]
MKRVLMVPALVIGILLLAAGSASAFNPDTLVTVGSPTTPFSQNKQNEPAVAIDANHPNVLVAGANDNIDMEACNAGTDNTCPFTPGVGVSGVYFSFDSGTTWTQPTYTGLTARDCLGVVGDSDPPCAAHTGPIGTLPRYAENGLVSDGDPGVAFGPRPGPRGFSWSNGSRLYYSNLTANVSAVRSEQGFKGFEAIAVSRTDNPQAAAANTKSAWMPPVLVSKQSSTTFSDKSQIWADNASSSRFFGTVYVCWAAFVGQEKGNAAPAPLQVAVSHDGGDTWTQRQISAAANNGQRNPEDGCTIRTDSAGNAYVFGVASKGGQSFEMMSVSSNGGQNWSKFAPVVGPVHQPGALDPVQGRPVIDGVAGARSDLAPAPSVDIANGAPTGADATDRIVMSYVSGPLATPHVDFTESTDGGANWLAPRAIESAGDRGIYTAPAISPNGRDVYVVYNAFTTPFQPTTATPRSLVGVVKHADTGGTGPTGAFSELHRGATGDPRGSTANALTDEFLGDYVYAAATRTYGAAVWNDARNAADCPAIDAYRQALQNGMSATAPAPQQACAPNFGNSDIYGGTYPDPTP